MIFQYGKTYRHTDGSILRIVGIADTRLWGKCLIGEEEDGSLRQISVAEHNKVNYTEIDDCPEFLKKEFHIVDKSIDIPSGPKIKMSPEMFEMEKLSMSISEDVKELLDLMNQARDNTIVSELDVPDPLPSVEDILSALKGHPDRIQKALDEINTARKYYTEKGEWR